MFSYQLVQGECHASTMSLERRAFYIAFGLCWTVCTFVGGYFVAREPLNEVLLRRQALLDERGHVLLPENLRSLDEPGSHALDVASGIHLADLFECKRCAGGLTWARIAP